MCIMPLVGGTFMSEMDRVKVSEFMCPQSRSSMQCNVMDCANVAAGNLPSSHNYSHRRVVTHKLEVVMKR